MIWKFCTLQGTTDDTGGGLSAIPHTTSAKREISPLRLGEADPSTWAML
jgi:hypothetical protein